MTPWDRTADPRAAPRSVRGTRCPGRSRKCGASPRSFPGGSLGGVAFPRAAREIPDPIPDQRRSEMLCGDGTGPGTPPHASPPPQTRAAPKPRRAKLAHSRGAGARGVPRGCPFPPASCADLLPGTMNAPATPRRTRPSAIQGSAQLDPRRSKATQGSPAALSGLHQAGSSKDRQGWPSPTSRREQARSNDRPSRARPAYEEVQGAPQRPAAFPTDPPRTDHDHAAPQPPAS